MDYQEVTCDCCGWEGNQENLIDPDVCPGCNQRGSLTTDG